MDYGYFSTVDCNSRSVLLTDTTAVPAAYSGGGLSATCRLQNNNFKIPLHVSKL